MSHFSRSRCSQMNDYFPINFFIRSTTSLGCGTTSYDETTRRLKKDLRANSDSIRFHLDMAALDDPRDKEFWDSSIVDQNRKPGLSTSLGNPCSRVGAQK